MAKKAKADVSEIDTSVSEVVTEDIKQLSLKEQKAEQEAKFKAMHLKTLEEAAKTHVMTREERKKQTEKFTAMIAKQSEGKEAPKIMTYAEKKANESMIMDLLVKQREDMKKGKKV